MQITFAVQEQILLCNYYTSFIDKKKAEYLWGILLYTVKISVEFRRKFFCIDYYSSFIDEEKAEYLWKHVIIYFVKDTEQHFSMHQNIAYKPKKAENVFYLLRQQLDLNFNDHQFYLLMKKSWGQKVFKKWVGSETCFTTFWPWHY